MNHIGVLPYFSHDVLTCPQPLLLQKVALAAEEFFRRTLLCQKRMDSIPIIPEQAKYELEFDGEMELGKLLNAFADDEEIAIVERSIGTRFLADNTYTDYFIFLEDRKTIGVSDLGGRQKLDLQVVLKPAINATSFPDEYDEHAADIALGAAAMAMMTKGEWSDMALAQIKHQMFYDRISTVSLQQAKSFSRSKIRSVGFHF